MFNRLTRRARRLRVALVLSVASLAAGSCHAPSADAASSFQGCRTGVENSLGVGVIVRAWLVPPRGSTLDLWVPGSADLQTSTPVYVYLPGWAEPGARWVTVDLRTQGADGSDRTVSVDVWISRTCSAGLVHRTRDGLGRA